MENPWIPSIPTFIRAEGEDGKERLYLLASNPVDIDAILYTANLSFQGVTRQKDRHFDGYYRIIKKYEEKQLRKAGFNI